MARLAALTFCFVVAVGGSTAYAEEFLGEDDEASSGDETYEEEPPPKAKKRSKKSRSSDDDAESHGSGSAGTWTISGGLGAGKGYFSGQVTIGYYFNKWVGIDTTGTYHSFDQGDGGGAGEQYGPEVDLVLRAANPTRVTPFVGVGPGYVKWSRRYDDEIFDDSAAWTGNAFGGLHVALTDHFGIQAVRKQVTWLGDPPKTFGDRETREAKTSISTNIGFHVSF